MSLVEKVKSGFEQHFSQPESFIVKAPGRVNLIGEHTDYNDGFVLPCAIDYATFVAVSPRADDKVSVVALDYESEQDEFSLSEPIEHVKGKQWANYVRGVVAELQKRNYPLKGCNLAITGNVPQGAGLSSSAALEVGVTYAFDQYCQLGISKQDDALISQAAENNFVGCACGIMDQLISACGKEQMALGIDCRSLKLIDVSIPKGMTIMMVNSNVKRGLVDSEYNVRRQQCEVAANHFGVSHLRDVPITLFELKKHELDDTVAKRAEHIVYENQRTLEAMKAFNENDIQSISQLMAQSHVSMRDLFEITTPEIDFLVDIIGDVLAESGGVRMTGGGFGGCIVALIPDEQVNSVTQVIEEKYQAKTGLKESIYISQPVQGVSVVTTH
ncbi:MULTISPECIES: galactokinase [unclassified Shewanella]|uniref:galactokinase n=1 Tax=unclassified Shewanella TaxID=196818 RepID=UPI00354B9E6B